MNKNDLKSKWSKYCDTDKLVDDMIAMLKKYRHPNSEHGVCVMINEYFTQKEPLLKLMITSKNYIGNMRIAVRKEFERKINASEVSSFFYDIKDKLHLKEMLQYENADGLTIYNYLMTGKKFFSTDELYNAKQQEAKLKLMEAFDRSTQATHESARKYYDLLDYMDYFKYTYTVQLNEDLGKNLGTGILLKQGTKTSRAFNAVCHHYGVDKLAPQTLLKEENGSLVERVVYPYDKVFAAYSDLVSNLARKMYFVISVNPLDYLMMSNGVSWKSCHNINDGCYKGGCLSYMLDGTSMVTFVVSDLCEPIHASPRFYRQMFHYDGGMFMQNRLYPQGNDGAVNLYDKFRGFIIEEFTELLNEHGDWSVDNGTEACKRHVNSRGTHYKDYHGNRSCNIFYPTSKANEVERKVMIVGHGGICPKCGNPYTCGSRLSHERYDFECTVE